MSPRHQEVRVPPYLEPRPLSFVLLDPAATALHGPPMRVALPASSFNGDLSGWDVSSVRDMGCAAAPHSPCPRSFLPSPSLGAAFRGVGVLCFVCLRVCSLSLFCFGYGSPGAVFFVPPSSGLRACDVAPSP